MNKTQCIIWFLLAMAIFSVPLIFCESSEMRMNSPTIADYSKSYNNILRALRENWESPITYLKKRGYLPKDSDESLYISKLNTKNQFYDDKSNFKANDMSNVYEFDKDLRLHEDMLESLAHPNKPRPPPYGSSENNQPARGENREHHAPAPAPAVTSPPVAAPTAPKPIPQTLLYTQNTPAPSTAQAPKKSFLKNVKDKFFGLFSKKVHPYMDIYSNDFDRDIQKEENKIKMGGKDFDKTDDFYELNKDFLKDFDKELQSKKSSRNSLSLNPVSDFSI